MQVYLNSSLMKPRCTASLPICSRLPYRTFSIRSACVMISVDMFGRSVTVWRTDCLLSTVDFL